MAQTTDHDDMTMDGGGMTDPMVFADLPKPSIQDYSDFLMDEDLGGGAGAGTGHMGIGGNLGGGLSTAAAVAGLSSSYPAAGGAGGSAQDRVANTAVSAHVSTSRISLSSLLTFAGVKFFLVGIHSPFDTAKTLMQVQYAPLAHTWRKRYQPYKRTRRPGHEHAAQDVDDDSIDENEDMSSDEPVFTDDEEETNIADDATNDYIQQRREEEEMEDEDEKRVRQTLANYENYFQALSNTSASSSTRPTPPTLRRTHDHMTTGATSTQHYETPPQHPKEIPASMSSNLTTAKVDAFGYIRDEMDAPGDVLAGDADLEDSVGAEQQALMTASRMDRVIFHQDKVGVWQVVKATFRDQGLLALWKGQLTLWWYDCSYFFLQIFFESLCYITVDRVSKSSLVSLPTSAAISKKEEEFDVTVDSEDSMGVIVGSHVISHCLSGLVLSPLELVRTRLQVQPVAPSFKTYFGPIHALRRIALEEEGGWRRWWGPSPIFTFFYHLITPMVKRAPRIVMTNYYLASSSSPEQMSSDELGLAAGEGLQDSTDLVGTSSSSNGVLSVVGKVARYFGLQCIAHIAPLVFLLPLETVRKRLDIQRQPPRHRGIGAGANDVVRLERRGSSIGRTTTMANPSATTTTDFYACVPVRATPYRGFWHCVKCIWREEGGIRAFYRGWRFHLSLGLTQVLLQCAADLVSDAIDDDDDYDYLEMDDDGNDVFM